MGRDGGLHEWQVIADPTDMFNRRVFRLHDVRQSAFDHSWPEGIAFRNLRTGEQLQFVNGQLIFVEQTKLTVSYNT